MGSTFPWPDVRYRPKLDASIYRLGDSVMIDRSRSRSYITPNREPIVYVVDDDRLMRETLSGLFRSVGWRVRLFESAQECWPIWFLWQKISGSVAGSDSENRQRAPKKIRVT
jgi:hypothetical protein